MSDYSKAAILVKNARSAVAFTGAGISVESGIPTFRGKDGLWSRYDPKIPITAPGEYLNFRYSPGAVIISIIFRPTPKRAGKL